MSLRKAYNRLSGSFQSLFQCAYFTSKVSILLPFASHDLASQLNNGKKTTTTAAATTTTTDDDGDNSALRLLCIPMHRLSQPLQFGICVLGVVFFYLLYGYSQEWIFRIEGFKMFGWYLTLIQFAYYTVFGLVERKLRREGRRRIPVSTYVLLAFLTVATMGLSNTSLGYLNYPTQVIFKSCKLIPVMIGGALIQGKRYTAVNVISMLCMCVGLVLFNLADISVAPTMDQTGIILISLALCADAVIGNVQEKAMKDHDASGVEMVLYSYSIGTIYILLGTALSGSLMPAFLYCLENPQVYLMAAVFSLTGYLGINFVMVLLKSFGALTAVTVTTFRKALTIVLSFLVFTKPFTQQYLWSGLIVLLGITLNLYCKNKDIKEWVDLKFNSAQQYLIGKKNKEIPTQYQV